MKSVSEQLKWIQFPQMVESPVASTQLEEGSYPDAMSDLLLQDEPLQRVIERIPSVVDYWQKEHHLTQVLGLANFDPDAEGMGDLMRIAEQESRELMYPHLSCEAKGSLSTTVFHAGVKMRGIVDSLNTSEGKALRSVGLVLPEHIKFLQGTNIHFTPKIALSTSKEIEIPTRIWVPPSPEEVNYEVSKGYKANGRLGQVTTYWFTVQIRPIGGVHVREMEISYSSHTLIPGLS